MSALTPYVHTGRGAEQAASQLRAIIRTHLEDLRRSNAFCHDAADMEQDAFLRLWEAYLAGKMVGELFALAGVVTRGIRSNFFRTRARRTRRRQAFNGDQTGEVPDHPGVAEAAAARTTALARLEQALASVPERVRVVVLGVRVNGRTQQSMAGELVCSRGTVQRLLAKAYGQFQALKRKWDETE
jgi:RNA polymerase sigma factor (sigma-70 family)